LYSVVGYPRERGAALASLIAVSSTFSGEEVVFAIEVVMEYQLDGRPPVTLRAGEVLFIPAEKVHAVKNVGGNKAGRNWPPMSLKRANRFSFWPIGADA
jgi:hypothetical protein